MPAVQMANAMQAEGTVRGGRRWTEAACAKTQHHNPHAPSEPAVLARSLMTRAGMYVPSFALLDHIVHGGRKQVRPAL